MLVNACMHNAVNKNHFALSRHLTLFLIVLPRRGEQHESIETYKHLSLINRSYGEGYKARQKAEEANNLVRSAAVTATYERNDDRTFLFETTPNPRAASSESFLFLGSPSPFCLLVVSVPTELLLLLPTPLARSSPVFVLPASLLRYERESSKGSKPFDI